MPRGGFNHPNIAAVWDYDEAGGIPFFVMGYYCLNLGMLMGESYRVEAPTRRLPLEKAVNHTIQTLAALAYVDWQDFSCRFHVRAVRSLG